MNSDKRLQYCVETDPQFIALSILALLYGLKRFDESKKFKFPQKLSTLVFFINSKENLSLFKLKMDTIYKLKTSDYELLNSIYIKSKLIEPQVNRVLNVLSKKEFVKIIDSGEDLSIILNKNNVKFIKNEIFSDLIENTVHLQKQYTHVSSVQYSSYCNKVFKEVCGYE